MYPVLNGLYTRGIGTAEDSIFSFTVQVHPPTLCHTSTGTTSLYQRSDGLIAAPAD